MTRSSGTLLLPEYCRLPPIQGALRPITPQPVPRGSGSLSSNSRQERSYVRLSNIIYWEFGCELWGKNPVRSQWQSISNAFQTCMQNPRYYRYTLNFFSSQRNKALKDFLKDHMRWDEAEKYISHLARTYDTNKDGKFNYPGKFLTYSLLLQPKVMLNKADCSESRCQVSAAPKMNQNYLVLEHNGGVICDARQGVISPDLLCAGPN